MPARPWGRSVVLRYSLASLVSVGVSQSVLVVAFGMPHWTVRWPVSGGMDMVDDRPRTTAAVLIG